MASLLVLASVCLVPLARVRDPASQFVGHGADSAVHRSEDAGIIRVMHTAGVDLGGTKVQGVVVDNSGKRVGEARGKTPVSGGPAAVVAEITTVVKAAAKDAKVALGKLAGIGIGSPQRRARRTHARTRVPGPGQRTPGWAWASWPGWGSARRAGSTRTPATCSGRPTCPGSAIRYRW